MVKRAIKIGLIYSSSLVDERILRIINECSENISFTMIRGLDEAIPVGKAMEKDGVEVIISRRGAAHLLQESLHIPVLSLPVSTLDILTSLNKAVLHGRKILFPVFRKPLKELSVVDDFFHIELIQGIYKDSGSLRKLISKAKDNKIDVVIGGGTSIAFAKEYNVRAVEIPVSEESLILAIGDAKSIVQSQRNELEKRLRYQSIFELTSDGIISVDENGIITTINKAAKTYLGIPQEVEQGVPLAKYLSDGSRILRNIEEKKSHFNKIEKIKDNSYITNCTPIHVGAEFVGMVSTLKSVSNVVAEEKEVRRSFAKGLVAKYVLDDFVCQNDIMKRTIARAKEFATTDLAVLIYGETGTGKEIIAQGIHNASLRKKGPFVSINCASLPDQLLENELFGHEEGAFTGSRKGGKPGLFEIAHRGSVFLDEITDMSVNVQNRLLRVLEEKEVMRIGGSQLIPVDIRIIAAANRKLSEEVYKGKFREDLFFRINILSINIPPLLQRIEDIPILICELTKRISQNYGIPNYNLPKPFVRKLAEYSWPGNVRQLEGFLERFIILSKNGQNVESIFEELYQELVEYQSARKHYGDNVTSEDKISLARKKTDEGSPIWQALEKVQYNKTKAAKLLGISRTTLWRKLKKETA